MKGWPATAVQIPKTVLGKTNVKKSSLVKSQRLQSSLYKMPACIPLEVVAVAGVVGLAADDRSFLDIEKDMIDVAVAVLKDRPHMGENKDQRI